MAKPLDVLNSVRIASPCPVLWQDMEGDDRVRLCGQCDCRVYNLSAVTAEEGVKILRETEGRLCVQLWRRTDGTLITADCPVGLRARVWRFRLRVAAVAASIASYISLPGCSEGPVNNYGPPLPATAKRPTANGFNGSRSGGMVCPEKAKEYREAQEY